VWEISDRLIYLAILRDFSGCLSDPEKTQLFGIFWDISSLCFCLRDMLKEPTSPKTKIEEGRAGIQKYLKKLANDQRISRVFVFAIFQRAEKRRQQNKHQIIG